MIPQHYSNRNNSNQDTKRLKLELDSSQNSSTTEDLEQEPANTHPFHSKQSSGNSQTDSDLTSEDDTLPFSPSTPKSPLLMARSASYPNVERFETRNKATLNYAKKLSIADEQKPPFKELTYRVNDPVLTSQVIRTIDVSFGIGERKTQEDRYSIYKIPEFPQLTDDEVEENFRVLFSELALAVAELPSEKITMTGSTALICLRVKGKLYTANVGDCRAVVIKNKQTIRTSVDHKADDAREQKRVMKKLRRQHGRKEVDSPFIRSQNSVTRLLTLAVTRTFGDTDLNGYGLDSEPEISVIDLAPEDSVVMGSDGLWDRLYDHELPQLIGSRASSSSSQHTPVRLNNRASVLQHAARQRGSTDNITVICTEEDGLYMIFDGHSGDLISNLLNSQAIVHFSRVFGLTDEPNLIAKSDHQNLQSLKRTTSYFNMEHRLKPTKLLFGEQGKGDNLNQLDISSSSTQNSYQAPLPIASVPLSNSNTEFDVLNNADTEPPTPVDSPRSSQKV